MAKTTQGRDAEWREELRAAMTAKERTAIPRTQMPTLAPDVRVTNNMEVNSGLSREQAVTEATRCLDCPTPTCVEGCPVGIDIPGFIMKIINSRSNLPAVCGRVCPQEKQCESRCIYTKMKKQPVAIGYLERFAADSAAAEAVDNSSEAAERNGMKVAVVGSGPAGLSFAGDMAKRGFEVDVFEALPEFRLPNSVVDAELDSLRRAGVRFHTDTVIGKTLSYEDLLNDGFSGLFVASGAGLPRFIGIPGENYIGVLSSNEYLTRINLMGAGRQGYDTPAPTGRRVAVVGGGNTAMDSVRTARRMGAERAMIIYRRSEAEMPARIEEVHHAKEEGVEFLTLCNPIEYKADERGRVRSVVVQRMELGEPDASGRRSPVPVEGAIEEIDVDLVIVSVGVSPNPLIPNSIEGLDVTSRGTICVDDNLRTSIPVIFAGGDIVRGGATVILAMGDGRRAAASMAAQLLNNE